MTEAASPTTAPPTIPHPLSPTPLPMRRFLKPTLFLLCSLPLAWLLARAFGIAGGGLGANPIDEIQDRLGEWGLRLLLVTLCVSPLAVIFILILKSPSLLKVIPDRIVSTPMRAQKAL